MAIVNDLYKKPGVYCITIQGNNKKYIGSSSNLQVRKNAHINMLRRNFHFNMPLQNSFNKYGEENYSFDVIKELDQSEIIKIEQEYIDHYGIDNLYNIFSIAGNTEKMIRSRKGTKLTKEHRQKISESLKGRVHSEETREKLRQKHLGKKLSKSQIETLRQAHLGKNLTEDHKERISKSNVGLHKKNNTSGYVGVHLIPSSGRYRVRIKNKSFGCFENKDEAINKAKIVYQSMGGVPSQL